MCQFDCFCVGEFSPNKPSATCLICNLRKVNLDLKPKKAMTSTRYAPRRLRIKGMLPKHISKVLKAQAKRESQFEALAKNEISVLRREAQQNKQEAIKLQQDMGMI
jgi:hypothetical protein